MYSQLGLSLGEQFSDLFTSNSRQLSLAGSYSKILHITVLRVYWEYSWEHFFITANVWAPAGHCITRGVYSIFISFFTAGVLKTICRGFYAWHCCISLRAYDSSSFLHGARPAQTADNSRTLRAGSRDDRHRHGSSAESDQLYIARRRAVLLTVDLSDPEIRHRG